MEIILKALALGMVVAFMVGPVFFLLLQTSVEYGVSRALFLAMGISMSDGLVIMAAYFGLSNLVQLYAKTFIIAGGITFVLFGFITLLKKNKHIPGKYREEGTVSRWRFVIKGFLLNAINPFVLLFWVGSVSAMSVELLHVRQDVLLFFSVVVGTIFMTDLTKAVLAHKLRNLITNRFIRISNLIMGIVLILFGIRILLLQGRIFSRETEDSSMFSIQKIVSTDQELKEKKYRSVPKVF